MNTRLFLCITLTLFSLQSIAQAPIVRQNGSTKSFYISVNEAVAAANNGDTIYIPGGSWSLAGGLTINKTIHIFGTGHNPDSSKASGITYLTNGSIRLNKGCSNGSLWGLKLEQGMSYSNSSDTIVNFSIRRCRVSQPVQLSRNFSLGLIAENVFDGHVLGVGTESTYNNVFTNNVFGYCIYNLGSGNVFKNNIFINPYYCGGTITNCLFENNIFYASFGNTLSYISNSIFNNNLFVETFSFPSNTNLGSNNIFNQPVASILINQSGTAYSYSHNFHLQATSPGVNAGTDGTDIGIYGGLLPWKDGSMPPNPQVQQKIIAGSTDQNGNLQINIKVKAQSN